MATARQTLIDIAVTKMIDHNGRIYNGEEGMEDTRPLGSLYAVGMVVDDYRNANKLPGMVEYFETASEQATKRLHADIKTQYEDVANAVDLPTFNRIEFGGRQAKERSEQISSHTTGVTTEDIASIASNLVYTAVRKTLELKTSAAWLADMFQRGDVPGSLLPSVTTLYGEVNHAIEMLEGRYGGSMLTLLLSGEEFAHVRETLREVAWMVRTIRQRHFTYADTLDKFPWTVPNGDNDYVVVAVDMSGYALYLSGYIRSMILEVIEQDIQA